MRSLKTPAAAVPYPSLLTRGYFEVKKLHVSATDEQGGGDPLSSLPFPVLNREGVYDIKNQKEYQAFFRDNKDKLVVLKIFAPWCKSCKALGPRYVALVKDERYEKLPIVWAQLNVAELKRFVKTIGVSCVPSVQFYMGGVVYDSFPCGPSKVKTLKRKLAQLVNTNVDPKTLQVKQSSIKEAQLEYSKQQLEKEDSTPVLQQPKEEVVERIEVKENYLQQEVTECASPDPPPSRRNPLSFFTGGRAP